MTNRERFLNTLNFKSVDRVPMVEWAPWWDKTIERWHGEGLPAHLSGYEAVRYFGLDSLVQFWFPVIKDTEEKVRDNVSSIDSYIKIKQYLYPEPKDCFDTEYVKK